MNNRQRRLQNLENRATDKDSNRLNIYWVCFHEGLYHITVNESQEETVLTEAEYKDRYGWLEGPRVIQWPEDG